MKIYTKTGDKGKTRLVGGCLVSKADLRIESYGSVDELNSQLGLLVTELNNSVEQKSLKDQLEKIQNDLFNLGSLLACEDEKIIPSLPPVTNESIQNLETQIDEMTKFLQPLKNFIIPGGHRLSALAHVARTQCRRAERNTVKLYEKHPEMEIAVIYLNRLSDYFFTLARYFNFLMKVEDQLWKKI